MKRQQALGRFNFAPPWWGVLLFVAVAGLQCALGVWQIERAHGKQRLIAAQDAAQAGGPKPMRLAHAAARGNERNPRLVYGRRYFVTGRFDDEHQVVLNDQSHGNDIGYRVWTPLVLANGIRVMVDRGWVPRPTQAHPQPPDPAAPSEPVRVLGFWQAFPQPALQFGQANDCDKKTWPRALNFPDAAAVRCQYVAPVANGLLLLDPDDPNGFVRDWDERAVSVSPLRHYFYASQWFLMAFVVAVIFIVVNSQRAE